MDNGWSGKRASRPELDRLLKDARQRRFDTVLVWKLDRWGRSLARLVQTVQELSGLGIRFIAVTKTSTLTKTTPWRGC